MYIINILGHYKYNSAQNITKLHKKNDGSILKYYEDSTLSKSCSTNILVTRMGIDIVRPYVFIRNMGKSMR